MMEMQEFEWAYAPVSFKCPDEDCGKLSESEAYLPVVFENKIPDVDFPVELECSCCKAKYDARIEGDLDTLTITLLDYPDTAVEFEDVITSDIEASWYDRDPYDLDPYEYDVPQSPAIIFNAAYEDILAFLASVVSNDGNHPLNRMIFIQCFSAFEAYLCDKLVQLVTSSDDRIKMYILGHKVLKTTKLPLEDLYRLKEKTANDILQMVVTKSIKETIFHDFPKVASLYKIFGLELFDTKDLMSDLVKAAKLRHHCVHRNGRDLEDNELSDFTHAYILEVITKMKNTADNLEAAIFDKDNPDYDF